MIWATSMGQLLKLRKLAENLHWCTQQSHQGTWLYRTMGARNCARNGKRDGPSQIQMGKKPRREVSTCDHAGCNVVVKYIWSLLLCQKKEVKKNGRSNQCLFFFFSPSVSFYLICSCSPKGLSSIFLY